MELHCRDLTLGLYFYARKRPLLAIENGTLKGGFCVVFRSQRSSVNDCHGRRTGYPISNAH